MAEKALECVFDNSDRKYTYKTCIEGLCAGDKVIVTNKQGLRVVTVVGYAHALPHVPANVVWQWAIAMLHETSYEAMKADGVRGGDAQ